MRGMKPSSPQAIRSVCVYCGSSPGTDSAFAEAATELGRQLAAAGLRLVYGGGDHGLMGAVATGVLANGGKVTGVIPQFLLDWEHPDGGEDLSGIDMITVPDMHTRKHMMFEEADAFVALPGGIGTLEELVEMLTWAQLKRHTKPVAVLNINGFWDPFAELMDHMQSAGFLHNPQQARPKVCTTVDGIMNVVGAQAVLSSL